jgi:hypothetical protein
MTKYKLYATAVLTCFLANAFAQTTTKVNHFDKVVVSPHIQVTFVEGNEESVTIESANVSNDKINIKVKNNTLHFYLDSAKNITRNKKVVKKGYEEKRPVYTGTVVTAVVTYKKLNELSLRGDETHICKSPLTGDQFRLWIYGESNVTINEVSLDKLTATMYGESSLLVKAGTIRDQKYTAYGEGKINSLGINGRFSKLTAYGEADFKMNVSDEIKMVAFGEAKLEYKGNPKINKGLHVGEIHIDKIDD